MSKITKINIWLMVKMIITLLLLLWLFFCNQNEKILVFQIVVGGYLLILLGITGIVNYVVWDVKRELKKKGQIMYVLFYQIIITSLKIEVLYGIIIYN